MTEVRKLTKEGLDVLRAYLYELKQGPSTQAVPDILHDTRYSAPLAGHATIEPVVFTSKFEFGNYIVRTLKPYISESVLRSSSGVWAWLVLYYFDQVCPQNEQGKRKVLSIEKYMASSGHISQGLDKHLLFFPWKMVSLHGPNAEWCLGGALREDSKVVRELANSYRRNVSAPFMRLAQALYYDAEKGRLRIGATTNRPGSLRRLDRVVSQLDLTYDVFGMSAKKLSQLLPEREFGKWLKKIQLVA